VPALWNIATEHNLTVGVAGWWASWPAEEVNGWLLTDHANPAFMEAQVTDGRYWTADPKQLAALRKDFFPPALWPVVQKAWKGHDAFSEPLFQQRAQLTPAQLAQVRIAPWYKRHHYSVLKSFFLVDQNVTEMAAALMRVRPTRLTMVYLRGPDPIQHYAWDLVEPERYAVKPANISRDTGIVQAAYRYVDRFVADLMAVAGDDLWTIVVSDHGAEPDAQAMGNPRQGRPGAHTFSAKGILGIHGPGVKVGTALTNVGLYDVMPTALWLLGLPISAELEGRPLKEAFVTALVEVFPEKKVASYGPRQRSNTAPGGAPSAADERMLESLRALGYLE